MSILDNLSFPKVVELVNSLRFVVFLLTSNSTGGHGTWEASAAETARQNVSDGMPGSSIM